MTAEEYDALSEEEQRIAVAELCGWQDISYRLPAVNHGVGKLLGFSPGVIPKSTRWGMDIIPDYLNDLNAMHEAEKFLLHSFEGARNSYTHWLEQTLGTLYDNAIFATAKQRCKAFVLTMTEEDGK